MFQQDLEQAHQIELSAIPVLQRTRPGSRAWPVPYNEYDFDLMWQWPNYPEPFGIEVKKDRLAERTGNVVVEHRSIGQSTALFALYHFTGHFWLIHMADLKGMIGRYPEVTGGEQGYTLTLVPEREFIRQAIFLN